MDGGVGPASPCRPLVVECLDATAPSVIEVPTESTLQAALASATANDVVQVRGSTLGSGWRVPPFVTLRGCGGARLSGTISFAGSGGVVEGFAVQASGSIVANVTGNFVVRRNRFEGGAASNLGGVSGRSTDALVSASVTLLVEDNTFVDRSFGVDVATNYDTLTHAVAITLRNNVFVRVDRPFVATEGGLVGVVDARLQHNTFYGFATAIRLSAIDRVTRTHGNLFVGGAGAIAATNSFYEATSSMAWQVTAPGSPPPVAGAFAQGDPRLLDPDAGDVRLGVGSLALDKVSPGPDVPSTDHQGCPRPAGPPAAPLADIGAFESQ